jgi:hypothetical protein
VQGVIETHSCIPGVDVGKKKLSSCAQRALRHVLAVLQTQPDAHLSHARVMPCTAPFSGSLAMRMHKPSAAGREGEGGAEGGRELSRETEGGREGDMGSKKKRCPSARSVPCAEGDRVLRGRGRGAEGDTGRERGRGCEGETCRRQGSLAHLESHRLSCTRRGLREHYLL